MRKLYGFLVALTILWMPGRSPEAAGTRRLRAAATPAWRAPRANAFLPAYRGQVHSEREFSPGERLFACVDLCEVAASDQIVIIVCGNPKACFDE